jgi:hypothetical protein
MARKMKFAILPPNAPGPTENHEHFIGRMGANGNVDAINSWDDFYIGERENEPDSTDSEIFAAYRTKSNR